MSELEALTLKLEAGAPDDALAQGGHRHGVAAERPVYRGRPAAALPRGGAGDGVPDMRLLTEMGVVCRVLMEDGSLHYRLSQRGTITTSCARVAVE
jgi:hypothetical protein